MLGSHKLGAITEVRLLNGCACTVRWPALLLKLKLFHVSDYMKNLEHIYDRKFIEKMCAKNYRNRWSSDKAIAKIKRCSFLPHKTSGSGAAAKTFLAYRLPRIEGAWWLQMSSISVKHILDMFQHPKQPFGQPRWELCNSTHGIAKAFPSVCQTGCDKTKETCANFLTPHERSFILVSWQEESLVGATPSTWNFGPNWSCFGENANFQSIYAQP